MWKQCIISTTINCWLTNSTFLMKIELLIDKFFGLILEHVISYVIPHTKNWYDISIIHKPLVSICYEGLVFRAPSNSWIGWKYTTSKESKTIKSTLYTSVSHYHNIIRGQKVGIFWFYFERYRKHSWHDCSV